MKTETVSEIVPEIDKELNALMRATGIAIDSALVSETPVDEGRAQGNWIVSVDRIDERIDIHPKGVTGAPKGQAEALYQGVTAIRAAPNWSTIYIQNNLPYINRLNDGHSDQAPSKFIERIINRIMAKNNEYLKKLGMGDGV